MVRKSSMKKNSLYGTALALMLAMSCQSVQASSQIQDVSAIRYISGGFGDEDLEALELQQFNHNLKMVFTTLDGAYVADISVLVLDQKKNALISATSIGPVMLIDLPAGIYQVQATYAQETILKSIVSDPDRFRTVYFRFGNR